MKREDQIRLLKHLIHQLDTGTNLDAGVTLRAPTDVYVDPERAARWTTAAPDVMSATVDTMVTVLGRLRSRWGGFAGYAAAAGLEADTIDRLRTKLVHSL